MKHFFFVLAWLTATPLAVAAEPAKAATAELIIMTNDGAFDFQVSRSWVLTEKEDDMPIAYMTFNIPNPADAGTNDSTFLSITAFDDTDEKALRAKNGILGVALGSNAPAKSTHKQWLLYTQQAKQGSTTYTIIDAATQASSATIHVRMAWPHLAKNPAGYDAQMKMTYLTFIDSVDFEKFNWSK